MIPAAYGRRAALSAAYIRDVPASCTCGWSPSGGRYTRTGPNPLCTWHLTSPGYLAGAWYAIDGQEVTEAELRQSYRQLDDNGGNP